MTRRPRTLFGRVMLALALGLVAIQTMAIFNILEDRAVFKNTVLGTHAAQRIARILSLLGQSDAPQRALLLKAISLPPNEFALSGDWTAPDGPNAADAADFLRDLRASLDGPGQVDVRILDVTYRDYATLDERLRENLTAYWGGPPSDAARRKVANQPVRMLSVQGLARMEDGTVVTFSRTLPFKSADLPHRLWLLLGLWSVLVMAIVAWAVSAIVRPLKTLAGAAHSLANNLDSAPLSELGPEEVAQAAGAFNRMQRKLRVLVDTRAQLMSGVSHDLRLPLTRIRMRIDDIGDADLRGKIEKDLLEMDAMISSALALLRANGIPEDVVKTDLVALVDGIADDMRDLGATVEVTGGVPEPMLLAPQAMRRCIGNVVDNARRYGGPGPIAIAIYDDRRAVTIAVSDRGTGIPEADLQRVLEPYVRVESSRSADTGGSGLGLSIAVAIARAHRGDVTLRNRASGGLAVTITLPRV